ncbi:MAG: hypothetical protein R2741_06955 [Methanolobus sp.]
MYTARRTNLGYSAAKVIVEKDTDKIVGAHVIGPNAEDTINIFTLAIKAGLKRRAGKGNIICISGKQL